MSKISLKPNANGTGDFTIKAPNSNSDRTLNLPDEAGTVLTNTSDIESQVKTATNATGSAPVYACRAFVNFDGTGTVSIRESGNVSSITDGGTGRYTANFTNSMPDNDFAAVAGGYFNTGDSAGTTAVQIRRQGFTTGSVGVRGVQTDTGTFGDVELATVAVFR